MNGAPEKKIKAINKDTLAYVYKTFKRRAADCKNKPDSVCTVVKFKYPFFNDQRQLNYTVKRKLMTMFQLYQKRDTSLAQVAEHFLTSYDKDKQVRSYPVPYTLNCYARVLRQDSCITTIETGGIVFSGGAHPLSHTGFINWNTKKHRSITLIDLIDPGNIEKLKSIAEGIFRKNEKLSDTASLANGYFFRNNVFSLNRNYLISPVGIRFLYNQYEIKPYVAGVTQLLVPWSKIKPLLRPETIAAQYIK